MIAANELRIGNWVTHFGNYGKIESIKKDFGNYLVYGKLNNCDFGNVIDAIQPIPLTPEILEKCGFEIHSKYSFWNFITKNGFAISMWMEDKPCAGFEIKGVCYWGEGFTEVKHLHQLQNLYFALTGQELTVNL